MRHAGPEQMLVGSLVRLAPREALGNKRDTKSGKPTGCYGQASIVRRPSSVAIG
jgi:hypothetical protein